MNQHQILLNLDEQTDNLLKGYLSYIGTHNTYFIPRVIKCFLERCHYDEKTVFNVMEHWVSQYDFSELYTCDEKYKHTFNHFEYGYLDNDLYNFTRKIYNSKYNQWFKNYMQFLSVIVMFALNSSFEINRILDYTYEFELPKDNK